MSENNPAIDIENLGVAYDGRWVLRGFSLRVARGEKVTLTGPSGVGKSTVLRCVLGLVVPQEGEVRVLGRTVDGRSVWEVRKDLAYVAQEPDLGPGTAREVIERPFSYRANAHLRANIERIGEWFERFRLPPDLLDKDMGTLSGGEKQRVALVSVMLLDRPILLLDEASSALDPANKQTVTDALRSARDLTVLSVSHDVEWRALSNRTIELAPTARTPENEA